MSAYACDLAIVGGGLAGGLIALAAAQARPGAKLLLVEAGQRLGGNHIWSFFDSDLTRAERSLVAPLVGHRWEEHDVAFPALRRQLATGYASIPSERLDSALRARLAGGAILTGAPVTGVGRTEVALADGRRIAAGGVIDARGLDARAGDDVSMLSLGWQKFVGQELALAAPHGIERPVVMDATVEQTDGYRFVYTLPFAPDRLFLEDTYYSDDPDIDVDALGERIAGYAGARGWKIAGIARAEAGALPVVMGGDFARLWQSGDRREPSGVAKAGARAGLFHPTTGYSLPDAVRTAILVARQPDWSGAALHDVLLDHARRAWEARGYYRLLSRLLFRAARPDERWRVMQRFYMLDEGLVGRFYAARSTLADKARILAGRPPVPVHRAIAALSERRLMAAGRQAA